MPHYEQRLEQDLKQIHENFGELAGKVQQAVSSVYDTTTFQDLVEEYRRKSKTYVPGYAI